MTTTTVSAKVGQGVKASEPISIQYNFGENLKAAVEKFGEEVVFSHYKSSAVIAVQSRIRAAMAEDVESGKKPNSSKIAESLKSYKVGIRAPAASKLEKAEKFVSKMSAEEKAELLKKLSALR